MTPLVAGIALTGKAPVYENVYMSGLKQKAAGEAAKAKEKAKIAEDIEKSINVDPSKYHYSMQNLVKEKSAEAVTKMRDAIAEDNVRGINKANDIKRDLLIDLAGMANASSQLFEREKPTYTSTYIRPEVTFSKLNSMDIREAAKDPEVAQELADYGWQINVDDKGRVSINFSDIKNFDVRKEYNTFQGNIIDQFAPELAQKFRSGGTTRQELSQVITKERSDAYLDLISSDPVGGRSAIFNWRKRYNIDITTPEGKQKVYDTFVAPERSALTSRPGGGGRGGFAQEMVVMEEGVEPIRTRFGGSRVITANEAAIVPLTTFIPNYNGAYITGEKANFTKLSQSLAKSYGSMQTQTIQNIPTWKGEDIKLPAGKYGDVKLDSSVTIMKGMPLPTDVKDGLLKYINDPKMSDAALKTVFGETDRAKIKAMIVNDDWIVGAGVDAQGNVKEETTFVPANATNLKLLAAQMQGAQKRKIAKKLIDAANDKSILYKATSEAKGAEKQTGAEAPQSTFNLLDIPTA